MLLKTTLAVLVLAAVTFAGAPSRQITVEWNPGCNQTECGPVQENSYVNVVYVKATGDKDEVHYLYSTFEAFTVLVFRSTLGGKLNIDWEDLLSGKESNISVTGAEILEKNAYLVPYFYEFEDPDGKASMEYMASNLTSWKIFPTKDFTWSKFTPVDGAIGSLEGKHDNSTFKFNLRNKGDSSRDKTLPHLLFTPETTTMDVVIDSPATWHLSKFALEFLYVSGAGGMAFTSSKTIDDEYTPGTFTVWNIEFRNASRTESFFSCKPSFYYSRPSNLENSTLARAYTVKDKIDVTLDVNNLSPLAQALFGSAALKQAYGMNISFGIEGSEKDAFFHSQTNFTTWSFSLGLGKPPVDKMSFIVTLGKYLFLI